MDVTHERIRQIVLGLVGLSFLVLPTAANYRVRCQFASFSSSIRAGEFERDLHECERASKSTPVSSRLAMAEGECSLKRATRRSFSLTSHASRAVGARRPATAPAMERAVPERALRLPLVYDVRCACRRVTLAGARRSAPVAP